MSDQFSIGLLAQIVGNLELRIEALEARLSEIDDSDAAAADGSVYLDGTKG